MSCVKLRMFQLLIDSEHTGTSDHSRAPDDVQNTFLQLSVPTCDAHPVQHHLVSAFILSHTLMFC